MRGILRKPRDGCNSFAGRMLSACPPSILPTFAPMPEYFDPPIRVYGQGKMNDALSSSLTPERCGMQREAAEVTAMAKAQGEGVDDVPTEAQQMAQRRAEEVREEQQVRRAQVIGFSGGLGGGGRKLVRRAQVTGFGGGVRGGWEGAVLLGPGFLKQGISRGVVEEPARLV